MNNSVALYEKRIPHISVPEWASNIRRIQTSARNWRSDSHNLMQTGTQLRNETNITTRWDTALNNQRIRDRIFEIETWRNNQRYYRDKVRDEINILTEEKRNTELCLESLTTPLMVNSDCNSNRDRRRRTELTHDHLGIELKQELSIMENNKRLLTDACHMGWEKLNDLTGIMARLNIEIQNKDDTLELERDVQGLTRESSNITYKMDPTRIPNHTMTEEGWLDCIKNTIQLAQQHMVESKYVRETMFRARERCKNELYMQDQLVSHVMRRRVYDIQRARNEMEWQKMKLENNMKKVNREIEDLHFSVLDKVNPGKLVETRLETRTRRPVLELVKDKVQDGLLEELDRIKLSENYLQNKLDQARSTYHGMNKHLNAIRCDLENKNHALQTDRRLIEIRTPLNRMDDKEMERGVGYGQIAEELPRM